MDVSGRAAVAVQFVGFEAGVPGLGLAYSLPRRGMVAGTAAVVVAAAGSAALLVLWDLTHRIGTAWWAVVAAVWRSWRYAFDPDTVRALQRVDALVAAFGALQALLVPFALDHPVLLAALIRSCENIYLCRSHRR